MCESWVLKHYKTFNISKEKKANSSRKSAFFVLLNIRNSCYYLA
jgi:hypothetical protein